MASLRRARLGCSIRDPRRHQTGGNQDLPPGAMKMRRDHHRERLGFRTLCCESAAERRIFASPLPGTLLTTRADSPVRARRTAVSLLRNPVGGTRSVTLRMSVTDGPLRLVLSGQHSVAPGWTGDLGREPVDQELLHVRTPAPTQPPAPSTQVGKAHRLLAGHCEICTATVGLEVHHVRKLADLTRPGHREKPAWMHLMAMRRRKTLVTCRRCHEDIHAGRATTPYPK